MLIVTIIVPDRDMFVNIAPLLQKIEEEIGELHPPSDDPEEAVLLIEEVDEEGKEGESDEGQFVLDMLGVDPNRRMSLRAFMELSDNCPINPIILN